MPARTPYASLLQIVAVVALVAAAANVTPVQAQNYTAQVRAQLDIIKGTVEDDGYSKTHEYRIESLARGRSESFTVTLKKGWEYVLVSACDADCSDVDIRVFDGNGNQVASDTAMDDIPVARVTPRWTGTFRVEISMHKCSNSPCFYGIGIFGK